MPGHPAAGDGPVGDAPGWEGEMSAYAEVLKQEDDRVYELFDVERETLDSGSILIEDPFPAMKAVAAQGAVQKGSLAGLMGLDKDGARFLQHIPGHLTYTAFSFPAVSRAFIENETFSSKVYYTMGANYVLGDSIITQVGEPHRSMRSPIQHLFTPQAAEQWWSKKIIDETVETLIASIEQKNSADLFVELCARMPVHVVSAGFGLAPEDIIPFRIALTTPHGAPVEQLMANQKIVADILAKVIAARRIKREDDIISKLIDCEREDPDGTVRGFNDKEIIDNCKLIVLAGGGTTWRQLGITLLALLQNPEQWEILKADRKLMGPTILESARWHPTDLIFPRQAAKDTSLEGVDIPEGALIHLCLGTANRDPARWENPDKFDITRPIQRSVGFAAGPHSCLGQHVSRQEMVTAINAVMDRLPNVRLDPSKPPPRMVGGLFARGPSGIPVVFG
jgi:cytochrome P450